MTLGPDAQDQVGTDVDVDSGSDVEVEVDVAVVGAGVAGLSAAWSLARDASVVVLEQEELPATHASGRSAAVLSETSGPAAVCALARASRPFLTAPPPSFTPVPLVAPRGMLWVSDVVGGTDHIAAAAAELGVAHRTLTTREATAAVSVLRADWVAAAVLEEDAMSIDVAALLDGYRAGLARRGGQLLTGHRVEALHRHDDRWTIAGGDRTVRCEVVVNAAGAWVDRVAAAAGLAPIGFQPLLRTAFTFPAEESQQGWPLVMDTGGRFYFEPEGPGLLASPADETLSVPHDARADELAMGRAVDALAEATTLAVRGVRSKWAGLRTFAPDRVPVVGFDPRAPGFFWLAGQGGGGIKTAPALAELASARILGTRPADTSPADTDPTGTGADRWDLGPERFLPGP